MEHSSVEPDQKLECFCSRPVAEQSVDKVASKVVPLEDSSDRAYYGLLFKLCGKEMKGLRGLSDGKGRSQDSTAVKILFRLECRTALFNTEHMQTG